MAAVDAEWGVQPVDWNSIDRVAFKRSFLADIRTDNATEDAQREVLGIRVEERGGSNWTPAPVARFEDLGVLPKYALRGLNKHGITAPLPIQAQALPLVLSGHDVIGIAHTGSGKTMAFLLPAVVHIEAQPPMTPGKVTPIALVMAPTRELAVQISGEASKVLAHSSEGSHRGGISATCLYGGGDRQKQKQKLSRGGHIVVATPGRLIDFVRTNVLSLERVTYFVLDEADRMLDMGFQGDVAVISGQVRPERQVLFFSATWSSSVQALARGLCSQESDRAGAGGPVRISVGQKSGANDETSNGAHQARESIVQDVIVVDFPNKCQKQAEEKRRLLDEYLTLVLGAAPHHKVLVFVSSKVLADELCTKLWEDGFKVGAMHAGKNQESRLWTLDQFRKGELQMLVATDVLGRGIDIPSISHVVVFDMGTVEDYIHRIGRTARGQNANGCALVFFEYYHNWPQVAANFVSVLETSGQPVPDGLRTIAEEVASGQRGGKQKVGVGIQGSWDRHVALFPKAPLDTLVANLDLNSGTSKTDSLRPASECVVFDGCPDDPYHPSSTPIYQTATFVQPSFREFGAYDYTRSGNPTRIALEKHVAMLDKAVAAFAFASNMAALHTVMRLLHAGDEIICNEDIHGGMHRLLTQDCIFSGINVVFADTTDVASVMNKITPRTKLIHTESPSNPRMRICDLRQLAAAAHRHGVLLSVDSTMMPPVICKPLSLGADIVVHSATKFFSGHADCTGSLVCVRDPELAHRVAFLQNAAGTALAPFESFFFLRGIKRVERAQESAAKVADFLMKHPMITGVFFPGHGGCDAKSLAIHRSQAIGQGSMISITTGSVEFSRRFCDACQIFKTTVSFGSVNSLCEMPCTMSHASIPAEKRTLPADMVRLSIGIEDVRDLISDLSRALDVAAGNATGKDQFGDGFDSRFEDLPVVPNPGFRAQIVRQCSTDAPPSRFGADQSSKQSSSLADDDAPILRAQQDPVFPKFLGTAAATLLLHAVIVAMWRRRA